MKDSFSGALGAGCVGAIFELKTSGVSSWMNRFGTERSLFSKPKGLFLSGLRVVDLMFGSGPKMFPVMASLGSNL